MRIILTKTEAITALKIYYHANYGAEAEILIEEEVYSIGRIISAVEALRYEKDQKIAAIKAMRQVIYDLNMPHMGLSDAKWAVEHWEEFKRFLLSQSKLPQEGYYNGLK